MFVSKEMFCWSEDWCWKTTCFPRKSCLFDELWAPEPIPVYDRSQVAGKSTSRCFKLKSLSRWVTSAHWCQKGGCHLSKLVLNSFSSPITPEWELFYKFAKSWDCFALLSISVCYCSLIESLAFLLAWNSTAWFGFDLKTWFRFQSWNGGVYFHLIFDQFDLCFIAAGGFQLIITGKLVFWIGNTFVKAVLRREVGEGGHWNRTWSTRVGRLGRLRFYWKEVVGGDTGGRWKCFRRTELFRALFCRSSFQSRRRFGCSHPRRCFSLGSWERQLSCRSRRVVGLGFL